MPALGITLATNVRAERSRKRWRQEDLAKALGMSVDTVSRMESGQRKITMDDLPGLCRVFGLPLAELLRGAEPEDVGPLGL